MGKTNGFMKKTLFALLAVFTAVSFLPKNAEAATVRLDQKNFTLTAGERFTLNLKGCLCGMRAQAGGLSGAWAGLLPLQPAFSARTLHTQFIHARSNRGNVVISKPGARLPRMAGGMGGEGSPAQTNRRRSRH